MKTFIAETGTMNIPIRSYKGLVYHYHEDICCLEVAVNTFDFEDEVTCINFLCYLVEITALLKSRYVIFNKLQSDFALAPELHNFVKNVIYKQLKTIGIRKVIFLTKSEAHSKIYASLDPKTSYMLGFNEFSQAFQWITDDIKSFN